MAFPSGCGLYVYVYKWNNASVGSSLTSCTYAVNYIQHDSNLYRLDWWGWDLRPQGERWTYNASSLALDISEERDLGQVDVGLDELHRNGL